MHIYKVGGAVRDQLLGISGSDRDYVVVGAKAQDLLDRGFKQVGKDFPVFLHPETGEEYALARTERKSGHGHDGFVFDFNPEVTLEEDLRRRDLTINAIAEDEDGDLIDPWGGLTALRLRLLRHVSPAFAEDPLRVLRTARFAARFYHLGFIIAPETLTLMRDMAESGELDSLTPGRIWQELEKALNTLNPEVFITVLRRCGALKAVFPEIDALYGVPWPKRWHPEIDSGVHTCMTLSRVSLESRNPVVRFAMLCHDLGKGRTPISEWPHHHEHNKLGLEPLRRLCKRINVPVEYSSFAEMVVYYHSFMHHVYRGGPEGVVDLLDKLDAWRRPWRIKPWVLCCKCDFLGRLGFENRPFPRADYFLGMFSLCATVKADEFVKQGFKGKEIGEQMRKRRIALMRDYFKMLPRSEEDDSANEMPPAVIYHRHADTFNVQRGLRGNQHTPHR